jgi:hypothetical protein
VNHLKAYKWLLIVEANGMSLESFKNQMQQMLTGEQIQEAQQKADKFIRNYKNDEDSTQEAKDSSEET